MTIALKGNLVKGEEAALHQIDMVQLISPVENSLGLYHHSPGEPASQTRDELQQRRRRWRHTEGADKNKDSVGPTQ
jgi:hypothetical protein